MISKRRLATSGKEVVGNADRSSRDQEIDQSGLQLKNYSSEKSLEDENSQDKDRDRNQIQPQSVTKVQAML